MANQVPSKGGSFLGGGPKFNQAGENAPLPGEREADEAPKPPFGGPRIWAGAIAVIVLVGVLWAIYGNGLMGVSHTGNGSGISIDSKPSDNADSPSSGQQ